MSNDLIEYKEDETDINDIISNEHYSILFFTASWCNPCKRIYPTLKEKYTNINNVNIYKINIDDNDKTSNKFNIKSVPFFLIFKNNIKLGEHKGTDMVKFARLLYDIIKNNNIKD